MDPGDLLRAIRHVRMLSQRELAYLAGVRPSTVDRIESGQTQHPTLSMIERILQATGFALVVADHHDRLLQIDPVDGRFRDRAYRRFPAHLEVTAVRDMRDPWQGWGRIAFSDRDRKKPDWTYWRRPRRIWSDDPWEDAT